MRIVWSPLALERVGDIASYIARDNPGAASGWVEVVFEKVKRLRRFPQSGRRVPEADRPDVREVFHGSYRVIYRLTPTQVAILTVRHGRQLLPPEDLV